MAAILRRAYARPDEGGFFYSANGRETASAAVNAVGRWDWTPRVSVSVPGGGTILFPLALGCRPLSLGEGHQWFHKRITDASQVADLDVPDVSSGYTGELLKSLREALRRLPPDQLVREPDIQSPLGIAELMWDDSFYIALSENPNAVHALLEKITGFVIRFIQTVQELAGERLNPCSFPGIWAEGRGTMIADDTMTLVSPEMHREFSLPYVNCIAEACGPLFYHSCSWHRPYFDNIHAVKNVAAYNWNPGNSDDPAIIMREFAGRAVLAPHLVIDMHKDNDVLKLGRGFADEFEFFRYMFDSAPKDGCVYFWFSNICDKGEVMERIYSFLHERGCTPQARGAG
ncbi:MAG TPA: hypothetical protein VIL86_14455 [Tepidisphaeraceae bacterium]|jgi:hypothetical protein